MSCWFCLGLHTPDAFPTISTCSHDQHLEVALTKNGKFIKDCTISTPNCSFYRLNSGNPYQIKKIVIDPGHGGRDHGCTGHGSKEKHLALQIAKRLGRLVHYVYPEVEVIYTRSTDVFVPLYRRAEIANQAQADLFISIHCNAISTSKIYGSETYVMGLHTAEENLKVAKRENASILLEDNYLENYGGYDPNSDEGHIFLTLFQNAFLEQSIQFAQAIEDEIHAHAGRKSRGVKQAGFMVLRQTTMPSVLVETGYLTNAQDQAFLASDGGQIKMAESIFNAFRIYKRRMEE